MPCMVSTRSLFRSLFPGKLIMRSSCIPFHWLAAGWYVIKYVVRRRTAVTVQRSSIAITYRTEDPAFRKRKMFICISTHRWLDGWYLVKPVRLLRVLHMSPSFVAAFCRGRITIMSPRRLVGFVCCCPVRSVLDCWLCDTYLSRAPETVSYAVDNGSIIEEFKVKRRLNLSTALAG